MTSVDPQTVPVVVVGIDFSEGGDIALQRALKWASDEQGEIHVVNVARTFGPMVHLDVGGDLETLLMEEASLKLKEFIEPRVATFLEERTQGQRPVFKRLVTHLRLDAPAEEIARLAADLEADLVVVGTHGRRGMRRLLLGSVAEGVVRLAPCPVLVVRPKGPGAPPPTLEPACPECLATRRGSDGEQLWCSEHSTQQARGRLFQYTPGAPAASGGPPLLTPMKR